MPESRVRRAKILREAEGLLELCLPRQALGALARLGDPTGFDGRAMYLWGEALRLMGRHEEALVPLSHAANADPEDIHVWLSLGWCYKRTGRIDLAIESIENALTSDPEEPLLHYNLACYSSLAGDRERAMAHLRQALTLDADYKRLIAAESDFDPIREDPEFRTLTGGTEIGNRG
ncbi:MAG: TPR end-of-group domain-containing protein [Planctomycetota bacterium]